MMYRDRTDAGEQLAERLSGYTFRADGVVLALPRGGVPVAAPVAARLGAPLDVLVVRKLGVPGQPELAMGAICNQVRVLDEELIGRLGITEEEMESITARERVELERRTAEFRPTHIPHPWVNGRAVIVVDDGIATGSTMSAACSTLRTMDPAEVIVAVPVGAPDAIVMLEKLADRVVCLGAPRRFRTVGSHYRDFTQTTDDEVRRILAGSL